MTPDQARAVAELRAIARRGDGALKIRSAIDDSDSIVTVPVRVRTGDIRRYPGGLRIGTHEDLEILIHEDVPLSPPLLVASDFRWAHHSHVTGRFLCLYIDPNSQWSPADGMYGFVHRVGEWLVDAAAGELDPHGGPLHPPTTLGFGHSRTHLVIQGEIPESEHRRLLWANLATRGNDRVDVVEFHHFGPNAAPFMAAALVSNRPLRGDYASTFASLVGQLAELGFNPRRLIKHIFDVARRNPSGTPLFVLVATLNRRIAGRRFHHLVGWELPTDLADRFRALGESESDVEDSDTFDAATEWAMDAPLAWVRIHEARESITQRRDADCAMSAFAGKRIELWGCGALGGWIAEFVARAGPASLMLRDKASVNPGLIVRQPYGEADVARPKAEALAQRLRDICGTKVRVESSTADVVGADGIKPSLDDIDLLIDATASRGVAAAIDRYAAAHPDAPPMVSVVTDARCELTALFASPRGGAGPGFSGRSALHRLKRSADCGRFVDAFWGSPRIDDLAQPEPGCSAPTFHGSAADAASAASNLANLMARYFEDAGTHLAEFTALPHAKPASGTGHRRFEEPPPIRVAAAGEYTVLMTEPARARIHEIAGAAFRSVPVVETGGLLIGERNDATRTITIEGASGPPSDSKHSADGFVRGTRDVDQMLDVLRHNASEQAVYLGDWHSHPNSTAALSDTDREAARGLVGDGASVLLIWAGKPEAPKWVAEVLHPDPAKEPLGARDSESARPVPAVRPRTNSAQPAFAARQQCDAPMPPRRPLTPAKAGRPTILVALSGGGFRATLAGLGVLRFLADADLLDDVRIISSVSGGSLTNALMATHWENGRAQPAFDELVLQPILESITNRSFLADLIRNIWRTAKPGATRTTVLADRLDKWFLDGRLLKDLPAGSWFMFNAANATEGIRFRFDADVIGDYVNGSIATADTNIRVSTAVAASAAVPGYFPPLRLEHLEFPCNADTAVDVVDGGVYDNLGLEAIQRRRDEIDNPFLISLNAGAQLTQGNQSGVISRLPVAGSLWRTTGVMHRQTSSLRTRRLFQESMEPNGRPFAPFTLTTEFPNNLPEDKQKRLQTWRQRNEEHTSAQRAALASIPTTFAKLDQADALALVQRGWWLIGAVLSVHHPDLLLQSPTWDLPNF
ncbi:patatin-like phospholipase family protein [Candidatus Poriferisodalis multihospitum]|uniref:patatin-like phospholipase family protein n=1 Tax=Candidatus Poriferisodalis multihospitum TaxID=2983191 RepID=UPI002B260DB2|nr:patatin-like phospholipase family protein [Candidatus Poriferisodalis multihospitum]